MSNLEDTTKVMKDIVRDSTELLSKTAELQTTIEDLQKKSASLEEELQKQNQKQEGLKQALLEKVEPFANRLVEHGSLSETKKQAFLDIIRDDPGQFVDVVQDLAERASVQEMGISGPKEASLKSSGSDPISEFANG